MGTDRSTSILAGMCVSPACFGDREAHDRVIPIQFVRCPRRRTGSWARYGRERTGDTRPYHRSASDRRLAVHRDRHLIIAITKRRRRSFEGDLLDLAGVLQLYATDVSYFLAFAVLCSNSENASPTSGLMSPIPESMMTNSMSCRRRDYAISTSLCAAEAASCTSAARAR